MSHMCPILDGCLAQELGVGGAGFLVEGESASVAEGWMGRMWRGEGL